MKEKFRFCKTKECRKPFRLGRGSQSYCPECVRARADARHDKRLARRKELKYPGGFGKVRSQVEMIQKQCAICFVTDAEHKKRHGCELSMHHVIMARVADQFGNAHEPFNLVPVCDLCHGTLKSADEALLRNDWMAWVQECRACGLPDQYLKDALEGYGVGWGRLPL